MKKVEEKKGKSENLKDKARKRSNKDVDTRKSKRASEINAKWGENKAKELFFFWGRGGRHDIIFSPKYI
jgi:hypothetical protein